MHEVCVAGGGVAGAACAALLARCGLDVVVIDRPPVGARDRREVLSPSALRALTALNLQLSALGTAETCRGVFSRWATDDPGFFDYELLECGAGASVSRQEFARALLDLAVGAGASVVATISRAAAELVPARFFVDATGRSGRVAQIALPRCYADRSVCIWTTHASPLRDRSVLVVDRARNGWWYAIPSSELTIDLAYVTDADCLPASIQRSQLLASEFREARLLASVVRDEPSFRTTVTADARSGYRATIAGDSSLSVGDAAVAVDPLSGNGIRLALEGASYAADAIDGALRTGKRDGIRAYLAWCAKTIDRDHRLRQEMYRQARRASDAGVFWQRRQSENAMFQH